MNDAYLRGVGIDTPIAQKVLRLANLAIEAGCDGILTSPWEAKLLRKTLPVSTLIVTPGTRAPKE